MFCMFFVMPFIRGGELYRFFKSKKRFKEQEVKFYAVQIALALGYLHKKGIVHRDLKPSNFTLGINKEQNIIHIIDFGLSKFYVENGHHIPTCSGKNLVGTVRYTSINVHKVFIIN